MILSPHTHIESALSASPVKAFLKKAKILGRTHIAITDHNMMASFMTVYSLAGKEGLKVCPGVEVYFKDAGCLLTGSGVMAKAKYYKITLFADTQDKFKSLASLVSKNRENKVYLNEENFDLWDWNDLEEAGKAGLICVGSDLNGLIEKPVLLKRGDISLNVVKKLKEIFNDNLYLSLVGVKNDKFYASFVKVTYTDNTEDLIPANAYVKTNAAKRILVSDLIDSNRHFKIESKIVSGIHYEVGKNIKSADPIKAFAPFDTDLQKNVNLAILKIGELTNTPVLYSDYAYYAEPSHKVVQDVKMTSEGRREYATRHMQSRDEALEYLSYLGLDSNRAQTILDNNSAFAHRFDGFQFKNPLQLPSCEGDINSTIIKLIKEEGRMKWDDPVYVERLKKEINVLANNGVLNFLPYFLPIRDVVKHYNEHKVLTGPGRGSAGGALLSYLLGITHIDPVKHGLSFERFQTLERLRLLDCPDIDQDLPNRKLLVGEDGRSGYLFGKYGNRAAQISNRSMLRLKSSIKDVNRYFNKGRVLPEIEKLTKGLPNAPQGVSDAEFVFGFEDSDGNHHPGLIEYNDDIKNYAEKFPKEWEVVQLCLGVSRQIGKHASAFVISDNPINELAPTFDGIFTQWDMKGVQSAGLIKYDFLVVKQLEDIQLAIELINKKNGAVDKKAGYFDHNGQELFIWDLPEDLAVYKSIWDGDTETIFQLHTQSMIPFVKKIKPTKIGDISDILALVRPGPLDFVDEHTGRNMAEEYIERRYGRSKPDIPEMERLLPETYGAMVYQEQTTLVAREIGKMSAEDAEKLRRLFSKKLKVEAQKMKPVFMKGAIEVVGEQKAEKIWAQMETSSRYSFNCIDGNQLVKTAQGLVKMSEIAENVDGYQVAYYDLNDGLVKYETPSFGKNMGEKEVWEVEMSDSTTIKATPDHRFLCADMVWRTLKDIVDNGIEIMSTPKLDAIKCECNENISLRALSRHLNHTKHRHSKGYIEKVKSLMAIGKNGWWEKSKGENATSDLKAIFYILSGLKSLDDYTNKRPRIIGSIPPKTRLKVSKSRTGTKNPACQAVPVYDPKELKEFALKIWYNYTPDNKKTKKMNLLEQMEERYPKWSYSLADIKPDPNLSFRGNSVINAKLSFLLDIPVQILVKQISKDRGAMIKTALEKPESRKKVVHALRNVKRPHKAAFVSKAHRKLFELIKIKDPGAILEYRVDFKETWKSYDIYSPRLNALIEMHGRVWHDINSTKPAIKKTVERNMLNDKVKETLAEELNKRYIVFWDDRMESWESDVNALFQEVSCENN